MSGTDVALQDQAPALTGTIAGIPQRLPEVGRVRLGDRDPEKGNRPRALDTWRFTARDEATVRAAAAAFGGVAQPWANPVDGDQWECESEAATIPVLVPAHADALDLAYERWRGGRVRERRCNGVVALVPGDSCLVDAACVCQAEGWRPGKAEDEKKGACAYTLRLRLVIPSLAGLGAWTLVTGSFYACTELPAQIGLLRRLSEQGAYIPADLAIDHRTEHKGWEQYPRRYPVPVLRVRASVEQIRSLDEGLRQMGAIANGLDEGPVRRSLRPSTIAHFPPHVQAVVYAMSEAGLTEEAVDALVLRATGGRTSSRREITVDEAAWITAHLAGEEDVRQMGERPALPPAVVQDVRDAGRRVIRLRGRIKALPEAWKRPLGLAWQAKRIPPLDHDDFLVGDWLDTAEDIVDAITAEAFKLPPEADTIEPSGHGSAGDPPAGPAGGSETPVGHGAAGEPQTTPRGATETPARPEPARPLAQQIAMQADRAGVNRTHVIYAVTCGEKTSAAAVDAEEGQLVLEAIAAIERGEYGIEESDGGGWGFTERRPAQATLGDEDLGRPFA